MKIETRRLGKYIEVKIAVDGAVHDLGLHDKQEAEKLSAELLAASIELQNRVEQLG